MKLERETSGAYAQFLEAMLFKRAVDTGTAAAFAKLAMRNPKAKEEFGLSADATEAEVAAKIEAELNAALLQAKVEEAFAEFGSAMQELWNLNGGPPK